MTETRGRIGVLLMSFGGPESLDEIPDFLLSLLGRTPPEHLQREVIERYRLLGGRSPLPEETRRQAKALEQLLLEQGYSWSVYVGMQHAQPAIASALEQAVADGVRNLIAVSLAPYRSQASTSAYEDKVQQLVQEHDWPLEVTFPPDWYDHPIFLDALAEKMKQCLADISEEERKTTPVIFSAHSLPQRFVDEGDPYVEQLEATAAGIDARIGPLTWRLAFQSRGGASHVPWLEPEVETVMDEFHEAGYRTVVVNPIGFVTDHLETLYDNDIEHKEYADKLGMKFYRCHCLNTAPRFIEALADIAVQAARQAGFIA